MSTMHSTAVWGEPKPNVSGDLVNSSAHSRSPLQHHPRRQQHLGDIWQEHTDIIAGRDTGV